MKYQYEINVNSKEFDGLYAYLGNDLGASYSKENTLLKVWAPTATKVACHLLHEGHESLQEMILGDKGVWSLNLEGDYELASYVYHIQLNEIENIATDPYAIASTPNHERTVIVDPAKTFVDHQKTKLSPLRSYTDAIIYEVHVRDFSTDQNSGLKNRGKFLAFTEDGTRTTGGGLSGVDYLVDLGVTHIQLLPVYDFGSVDELDQYKKYNWGYDPVQYNVPEGSYSRNVEDPYSRIIELKQAIAHLHSKGLRVIMDVVYNHMYDQKMAAFEKIVPGYYFRSDEKGTVSNGSFCGNDMDSTRVMVKQFFYESTRIWIEDYGFDGFRFDLMGILDIETMNHIAKQTLELDASAMIYGEGWNMPTFLDDSLKATMMNHKKMPLIAHFSDLFRDGIKGGTLEDKFNEKGYGTGDAKRALEAAYLLQGTVRSVGLGKNKLKPYFEQPTHTLNYVECHDNHTLWDKLVLSCQGESEELLKLRHRFMTTMVIISQGIPFLHGGQEFMRTKGLDHNSFESSDMINMYRWLQKDEHLEDVHYVKDLVKLRKTYAGFRLNTTKLIKEHVDVSVLSHYCIAYEISPSPKDDHEILVLINPNIESITLSIEKGYQLVFNQSGFVSSNELTTETVTLNPLEISCYIKRILD